MPEPVLSVKEKARLADRRDEIENMKLAEALMLRGDLAKRMEQIRGRALRNARVQEGDAPGEDPSSLMSDHDRLAQELQTLIIRINRTNSATPFADGTLTDALAKRDVLRQRQSAWRDLAEAATVVQTIGTRSEVRFRSAIDVAKVQKTADDLAQELRKLDLGIQEANWLTSLID